ncbi:hypothetical protein ACFX1X_021443 [Malus domestica]
MKIPRFSEVMQWILGTFGIIESALTIPFRNPNFIILTLITSLPLFFLTLIHQLPYDFQPSLIVHAINLRTSLSYHSNPMISDISWALDVAIQILQVYFFTLGNFLIVLTTIHAASTIYASNERSMIGLRNLLRSSVMKKRWHERMLTFFSISLLCNLSSAAVVYWHYARPLYPIGCPTRFFRLFRKIHWIVYGLAFAIWLDYSARWNLSVVVSILEEKVGVFEAISASSELTKGNRLRGFFLMLLYSVAKFNLPALVAREFTTIFAFYFLDTIFMCLGNVIIWEVLTVYYYDCKNRHQKAAAVTSFDTGNTLLFLSTLVNFLIVLTTIDAASTIYTSNERTMFGL